MRRADPDPGAQGPWWTGPPVISVGRAGGPTTEVSHGEVAGSAASQPSCSRWRSPAAPTTAGVTSGPATEEATTPATESSGAGNGTRTETNQPAVTVPQLPIGGGADDPGDVEQCVSVSFLGDEISAGVAIVPDTVTFSEPLFERGGSECSSDDTPCLSGGFAFTAANDDTQEGICFLAVRAIGERAPDEFGDVQLTMTGRLECPPGREAACEEFAEELDADEQTIDLTPPTAEITTSEATSTEATTSTSETTGTTTTSEEASPPTD